MQVYNRVPLFVCDFVDHAVPREAGIVHDEVDLAAAELRGFLDEVFDVLVVEDVAGDGDGLATRLVDLVGYLFRLFWEISVGLE